MSTGDEQQAQPGAAETESQQASLLDQAIANTKSSTPDHAKELLEVVTREALAGTVRALVLLMKSLACPTDPDDRLPVRGEALIRLWAIPFSTFVSNMRRDSRKNYDESRLAFSQALADLQRTIKAILSDRRVSAPKRLQQVARKLVRFLVHSFDFLKAAELTSAPLHHCNQA